MRQFISQSENNGFFENLKSKGSINCVRDYIDYEFGHFFYRIHQFLLILIIIVGQQLYYCWP